MSFPSIFMQSNWSFALFDKMVLECSPHKIRDNRVVLDMGLKTTSVCLQTELQTVRPLSQLLVQSASLGFNLYKVRPESNRKLRASRFLDNQYSKNVVKLVPRDSLPLITDLNHQTECISGDVQRNQSVLSLFHSLRLRENVKETTSNLLHVRLQRPKGSTEPRFQLPSQLARSVERKFVWLILFEQLSRRLQYKNVVFGRVVRSLKGGYAVAIPGYIAFLPKSLSRKQFRLGGLFSILKMNAEKRNIVVRQLFLCKRSIINALRSPLSSYRWLFPYSVKSQKY